MYNRLRGEARNIIKDAFESIYWMRGSISYFEFYELTYIERQVMDEFIKKRMETESKKPPHMNRVY